MNFSLKLKELREERGFSQAQLAKALNVGVGSVGMWESTDRIPPAKKLVKIAEYFHVSTDYLLGRSDKLGGVIISDEERAAGWSDTARVTVTPIEDDMLQLFRKIGKKYGTETQKTAIAMLENMLGLK